jgi:hypothetical protein
METKSTFDEWFYYLEYFSLKSERFFGDCDHYLKDSDELQKTEGEAILLSWLKSAFEAGRESGKKA